MKLNVKPYPAPLHRTPEPRPSPHVILLFPAAQTSTTKHTPTQCPTQTSNRSGRRASSSYSNKEAEADKAALAAKATSKSSAGKHKLQQTPTPAVSSMGTTNLTTPPDNKSVSQPHTQTHAPTPSESNLFFFFLLHSGSETTHPLADPDARRCGSSRAH